MGISRAWIGGKHGTRWVFVIGLGFVIKLRISRIPHNLMMQEDIWWQMGNMVIFIFYGIFLRNDNFSTSLYRFTTKVYLNQRTKLNQRTLWLSVAIYGLLVTKQVCISVFSRLRWCFMNRYSTRLPDHSNKVCVDTFLTVKMPGIVDFENMRNNQVKADPCLTHARFARMVRRSKVAVR